MRALSPIVCAAFLLTGCSHVNPKAATDSGHDTYVVHVELIEFNASHLPMQDAEAGKPAFPILRHLTYDDVAAFPGSRAIEFLHLELSPGQQREISEQQPLRYASEHDTHGEPTAYATRGVGKRVQATLVGVEDVFVDLKLIVENVSEPIWQEVAVSNAVAKVRMPFFFAHSVSSELRVFVGSWVLLGGFPREMDSEQTVLVWALRVREK